MSNFKIMRTCKFKSYKNGQRVEGNGLFHQWGTDIDIDGTREAFTIGIVESNGEIYHVYPPDVTFTDTILDSNTKPGN